MARQVTGSILTDIGDIYKRLLNHRPVIQNEVYYFVREFESKRDDSGLKNLQDAMKYANEMDAVFLEEIKSSSHRFKQITTRIETVNATAEEIVDGESNNLNLPPSEQEELDKQVKDCRKQFHDKQDVYDTDHSKQVEQLKEEIRSECEAREKLRTPSRTSIGSSITIFPPEARSQEGSETSSASPDMTGSKVVKETKSANEVVDNEEEAQETQAVVDNEEETQAVVVEASETVVNEA